MRWPISGWGLSVRLNEVLTLELAAVLKRREWVFHQLCEMEVTQTLNEDLNMRANVCAIAGEIRKVHKWAHAWQYQIDAGPHWAFPVWCMVFKTEEELFEKWSKFHLGDYVQIVGHYSTGGRAVIVERIKNDPPNRAVEASEVPWEK